VGLRNAKARLRPKLIAAIALLAPRLWPLLKSEVASTFDSRAAEWDHIVGPSHSLAVAEALNSEIVRSAVEAGGAVLDFGCGTGLGTELLCKSFPNRTVVGVDISLEMLRRAASKPPAASARRSYWVAGDAARPPFRDGCASLILLMNAPPFVKALSKLLRSGGVLAFVWSQGKNTPIWISPRLIKTVCRWHRFRQFIAGSAGEGRWLIARR
jgi:trans-aconitate methyltransferase